jgi:hypothetical protein
MATKPRACSQCRRETTLTGLEPVSGAEKTLTVKLHGLPVLVCPSGHRQFAHPEFPIWLLEQIVEKDVPKLPAGEGKGMLFKKYHCSCGAELPSRPDQQRTFPVEVSLRDLAPFRVELTVPVYKCAACGKAQAHSLKELQERAPAALAHAFQEAKIAHG